MDYIMAVYPKRQQDVMDRTGPTNFARFVYLKNMSPDSDVFLPTCAVLPYVHDEKVRRLARGCNVKDAFVVTYWNQGSGWGQESLASSQSEPVKIKKLWLPLTAALGIALVICLAIIVTFSVRKTAMK